LHRPFRNREGTVRKKGLVSFGVTPADIYVDFQYQSESNCSSSLGNTFSLPDGIEYDSQKAKSYLAGSQWFSLKDVEVYRVEFFC
jgi:hypothetical protein